MTPPGPSDDPFEDSFQARERGVHGGAVRNLLVLRMSPPVLLLVLYGVFIAVGAGLLMLPFAAHAPTTLLQAVFTSVSAVTVTGLAVVDTGSHFTGFGQAVIAVLIQFGGLGLMTFAVLILSLLGLPMGLPRAITLREETGQTGLADLGRLVRVIAIAFLVAETIGTALLATVFVPELGWGPGLWHALFHAISAFNNAGFGLWPDSLTRYATDPTVNLVVPLLFIVGGLGFVVLGELWRHRRWAPLSLHSKLMIVGTAGLLAWGTATFAALEWSNPATLGLHGAWHEKLLVAWFQGATPRTAGFNSVDFALVHDSTAFLTITLMLVGGGATSTAGGIKVTTFIAVLLATLAFFRRRSQLVAFGRAIPIEDVLRVMALVAVAILFLAVAMFVVLIGHDGDFLDLLFEMVSAFATVGLSRGITAQLDALEQIVAMALMFAGRVGPLTFGFFLATRAMPRVRYPRSPVYLG